MDKAETYLRLIEAILRNQPSMTAKLAAKDAKKAVKVIFG